MKGTLVTLLLVSACVAVSHSFPDPGQLDKSSDEVNRVPKSSEGHTLEPLDDMNSDKEINFDPFAYTPLATFIQSVQAMMKKMQMHMGEVLRDMPPQEIDWAKLGNMTSHTKVVKGHKITVNETTYSNKKMPSEAVLHVRVVDNKPTERSERESSTQPQIHTEAVLHVRVVDNKPTESSERESSTQPQIHTEADSYVIRSVAPQTRDISENYIYAIPEDTYRSERQPSREYENDYSENVGTVDNSVELIEPSQPIDLSGDTRVNDLKSNQVKKGGLIMIDPDAELIEVVDGEVRNTYYPYQTTYDQQHIEEFLD